MAQTLEQLIEFISTTEVKESVTNPMVGRALKELNYKIVPLGEGVTPEMLAPSTIDLINASGGGSINNMPDNEDLTKTTTEEGIPVLKFADKVFAPAQYSGLARKYLRKNMSDYDNVLTQEMVNEPNTIYHIQYDYDLKGETITIPENCVLQFDGGSIKNGKLVGNILNEELIVSRFGSNLIDAINMVSGLNVDSMLNLLIDTDYEDGGSLVINRDHIVINGDGHKITSSISFQCENIDKLLVKNLSIESETSVNALSIESKYNNNISTLNDVEISNCVIKTRETGSESIGLRLYGNFKKVKICDNTIEHLSPTSEHNNWGITLSVLNENVVGNLIISNNIIKGFKTGIDNYSTGTIENVIIDGNLVSDCDFGVRTYHMRNCLFSNNIIQRCGCNYIWSEVKTINNNFTACGTIENAAVTIERHNSQVNGNVIEYAKGDGIEITGQTIGSIRNNVIKNCAGNGIVLTDFDGSFQSTGIDISFNKIYNNEKNGILALTGAIFNGTIGYNYIGGNCKSEEYSAIRFEKLYSDVKIIGNIIWRNDTNYGVQNSKMEVAIAVFPETYSTKITLANNVISSPIILKGNGFSGKIYSYDNVFDYAIADIVVPSAGNVIKDKVFTIPSDFINSDCLLSYNGRTLKYISLDKDKGYPTTKLPIVSSNSVIFPIGSPKGYRVTINIQAIVSEGLEEFMLDGEKWFDINIYNKDEPKYVIERLRDKTITNWHVQAYTNNSITFERNDYTTTKPVCTNSGNITASFSYLDANNLYLRYDGYADIKRYGGYSEINSSVLRNTANFVVQSGLKYWDTDTLRPIYYHNRKWYDSDGFSYPNKKVGTTQERPSYVEAGFQYFDTTLNRPIWKTTTGWVDATGSEI